MNKIRLSEVNCSRQHLIYGNAREWAHIKYGIRFKDNLLNKARDDGYEKGWVGELLIAFFLIQVLRRVKRRTLQVSDERAYQMM